MMFLAALTVIFSRPPRAARACERIMGYRMHEPPEAAAARRRHIGRNKRSLSGFRDDPGSTRCPRTLRSFVLGRLKEIEHYEAYAALAVRDGPGRHPHAGRSRTGRAGARGELALPSTAWEGTPAAELREKWLADARPPRRGAEFLNATRTSSAAATALQRPLVRRATGAAIRALFAEGAKPRPHSLSRCPVHRPSTSGGPAGAARVPYEFQRVYHARRDWGFAATRLVAPPRPRRRAGADRRPGPARAGAGPARTRPRGRFRHATGPSASCAAASIRPP